jgi:triphosphatase
MMTQHPPTKPAREVELKLAAPDGAVDTLLQHPALQLSSRKARRRHEVTTYFDTPDHALAQAGLSLRVRRTEGKRVQTLKANPRSGVTADRAEWEWPVQQDKPDLSLLAQTPIAEKLPRAIDLEPVFVTDINRTVSDLAIGDDTHIEAALDEGVITADHAREPVRELELELRQGDPASLYRLALELHAAAPMTVMSESKAARGYRLRSGGIPAAQKSADVTLARRTSAAAAFRQILTAGLGHLLANQPAALCGDAEGIHQMRVAIRRLRAAMTLFEQHLEPHAASRFEAELRRVGQIFGHARDWDVFCLQILPETSAAADWRNLLLPPATAQRETAHQRFNQEVQAPPFTALVLGLAAWTEGEPGLLGDAALDHPIEELAPRLLGRLAHKVERRGRDIEDCSDAERHALRKSLKKLRYGVDYLQALYPPKSVESFLRRCKKLQQVLGDINDSVTAIALAGRLADAARPDLAPAVGALAKQLDGRRQDALRGLAKRWKAFQAEPRFWDE